MHTTYMHTYVLNGSRPNKNGTNQKTPFKHNSNKSEDSVQTKVERIRKTHVLARPNKQNTIHTRLEIISKISHGNDKDCAPFSRLGLELVTMQNTCQPKIIQIQTDGKPGALLPPLSFLVRNLHAFSLSSILCIHSRQLKVF